MLSQALNQSELDDTEKRMLLDKANLTDYQATDQELLAQVARYKVFKFTVDINAPSGTRWKSSTR